MVDSSSNGGHRDRWFFLGVLIAGMVGGALMDILRSSMGKYSFLGVIMVESVFLLYVLTHRERFENRYLGHSMVSR